MNRKVTKNLIQAERLHKRVWRAANEAEAAEIDKLIRLLDSQLTINESNRIPMKKLEELLEKIRSEEVSLDELGEMDPNQLFEFITGEKADEE